LRRGQSRKEQRDGSRVGVKALAVALAKLPFFAPHYGVVEHGEIDQQHSSRNPRTRRDRRAGREKQAAEVKWVPRMRGGSRNRQHFLLVQMSSGESTNDKPHETNRSATQDCCGGGMREPENSEGDQVAGTNAPADKKTSRRAQRAAPMRMQTASNAES